MMIVLGFPKVTMITQSNCSSNFKVPGVYLSDGNLFRRLKQNIVGGSPGDVSEEPVTYEKRKTGWRMSCDVGKATEGLENEL